MPLDPQAKVVCDMVAATRIEVAPEDRVATTRQGWGLFLAVAGGEPEPVFATEDRDADGVPVRIYRPSPDPELPVFVVFHGGGWVIGSVDTFDGIACRLANASEAIVVSVDYRLAPEHPYPAPLDDCWHALQWTAAHAGEFGGDATRLAVGGDSAGGNLAAVCAQRARDLGLALTYQVLVYPVCDCDFDTVSYTENAEGYLLEREEMQWFFGCYTDGGRHDPAHPSISPLRATDLREVAPALVITAGYDPLRDEGEAYAARLRDAGVPVETKRFDGMIHGFFGLTGAFDAARDAVDLVGTSMRRAFGTLDG